MLLGLSSGEVSAVIAQNGAGIAQDAGNPRPAKLRNIGQKLQAEQAERYKYSFRISSERREHICMIEEGRDNIQERSDKREGRREKRAEIISNREETREKREYIIERVNI